jgi:hypothetical protein
MNSFHVLSCFEKNLHFVHFHFFWLLSQTNIYGLAYDRHYRNFSEKKILSFFHLFFLSFFHSFFLSFFLPFSKVTNTFVIKRSLLCKEKKRIPFYNQKIFFPLIHNFQGSMFILKDINWRKNKNRT